MRSMLKRLCAAVWILGVAYCTRRLFTHDWLDIQIDFFVRTMAVIWAAQFILTGIVNPVRLFVEAFSGEG